MLPVCACLPMQMIVMAWIRARLMPESITCRKSRSILTIKKTGGLFDKPVLKENAQRYPIYLLMMLKAGIFPAFSIPVSYIKRLAYLEGT